MNPYQLDGVDAGTYVDVRPSYPECLVDSLVAGLPPSARVIDMGAGTGKLTRQLLERGFSVVAIEPSELMLEGLYRLKQSFGDRLAVVEASAESTSLERHAFDLVVFSQSWHWVATREATNEAFRLLKKDGKLAAVYNQLDVSFPWVKRLTRIMRSGDVHRLTKPPQWGRRFSLPSLALDSWVQYLAPDELQRLGTTRASWIKSTGENRTRMRANLDRYLDEMGYHEDNLIELPYLSFSWSSDRK